MQPQIAFPAILYLFYRHYAISHERTREGLGGFYKSRFPLFALNPFVQLDQAFLPNHPVLIPAVAPALFYHHK